MRILARSPRVSSFARLWLALLIASAAITSQSAAQDAEPDAPRWRVNAAEFTIGGRVQTQLNTTSAASEPSGQFLLRRVRLDAAVRVNDLVSGRVQTDFAGDRVAIKDAYLQLDIAPTFRVIAGQAHRPFSLLEMTSSTRILPVERGVRLRGVPARDAYVLVNGLGYSDRDIGLQLLGSFATLSLEPTYRIGLFRGPLHGALGSRDSYQIAARGTIRPLEPLRIGMAVSSRDFAGEATGQPPASGVDRGTALSLDLEYGTFAPGLHFIGEVVTGAYSPFQNARFHGAQGWLAYRTTPRGRVAAIEPVLRVSHGAIDRSAGPISDTGGTLLTPGINVHLGGLNRVMLNYDVWLGESGTESGLKAQFQLAF